MNDVFFSFLVPTDVTNFFRIHFRKPCADANVASAGPFLYIWLPRASALLVLDDLLPRPRRGACFSILWEFLVRFVGFMASGRTSFPTTTAGKFVSTSGMFR